MPMIFLRVILLAAILHKISPLLHKLCECYLLDQCTWRHCAEQWRNLSVSVSEFIAKQSMSLLPPLLVSHSMACMLFSRWKTPLAMTPWGTVFSWRMGRSSAIHSSTTWACSPGREPSCPQIAMKQCALPSGATSMGITFRCQALTACKCFMKWSCF